MLKIILLLSFFALNINAQSAGNYNLVFNAKIGIMFPGQSSYNFSKDPARSLEDKFHTVNPNYYFGGGIESNNLIRIKNARLNFAIELSYGKTSTGEVDILYGNSEFQITSLPIVFWSTLKTEGLIVPYVKLGMGVERTQLIEKYYSNPQYDFDITEWILCGGIGAGIDFNYFERVKFSLFVDSIVKDNSIFKKLADGREVRYNFLNGVIFCGVQFGYKI